MIIPALKLLPTSWEAERKLLEPQGIQSLIAIPMMLENQTIGFIGLDSVKNNRTYNDSEINILQVWGNMFSSLINYQRAELIIRQTRKNYETFFNSIDDFLFVLDEMGKIIYINNTVTNRLGYPRKEIIGKTGDAVYPLRSKKEVTRIFRNALKGNIHNAALPLITKGGEEIPVDINITIGKWNGKQAIFGVAKDISAIKLSEEKFSKAFHASSALMAISGLEEGKLIDVNQTFLKTLGFSREEVIGKTIRTLNIYDNSKLRSSIISNLDNGMSKDFEVTVNKKSGEKVYGLFSAEIIYIGNERCLMTMIVDITERKQNEEKIQRQAGLITSLLDSIPDFIFYKDNNGVFLGCNPPVAELVGRTQEEIRGKTDYDLFPKAQADWFKKHDEIVLKTENPLHVEELIEYKDGRKVLLDTLKTIYKGSDGKVIGMLGIGRDITQRKQAETELRKAKTEAEKANKAKSEFLSRMSHELRTPMNSILGFSQLLEMGDLNTKQAKAVKNIIQSGKHLLDLINEVLDLSRIEAGRLKVLQESVNLKNLILEILDAINPMITNRRIIVELTDQTSGNKDAWADRKKIRQVFINLLSNAIKYNIEGGTIIINITDEHAARKKIAPGMMRVSVRDTGIGISKENIQRLFEPFERGGADSSQIEGSGLGLTVVKKLVEAMNGKVNVESEEGRGTHFWIDLPVSGNSLLEVSSNAAKNQDKTKNQKGGTLLYVEDNASNYELISEIIETQQPGIKLITAVFGNQAEKLAEKYRPGMILLDLHLPDISGIKVLEKLRSNRKTAEIPVVILSADAMEHQQKNLMDAGADDFITKPLELTKFNELIDKYFMI